MFSGKKPDATPEPTSSPQRTLSRLELLTDVPIIHKPKSSQSMEPQPHVDFSKVVEFRLDGLHAKIRSSDAPQTIPVMVTVGAKDVDLGKQRLGLDVVMIIDISGSMSGEKIKLVVETLLFIIDEMQETDRLSLIAFDNVSEILTSLTPMTAKAKEEFKKKVLERIKSRGDTDIRKGLVDGFEVLLNRKEVNDVTAVFLLSDGQDTCGNNQDTFKRTLEENDKKMAKKGMSYKINSFGYGEGHDEKVLGMISQFKEGNFYYIKNVQLVDECFIDCLGYLMSVFGSQAEVSLYVSGKTRIVKKYGASWADESNPAKATLKVGNLAAGKERNFVLELEVPPTADLQGVELAAGILNFIADKQNNMLDAKLVMPVAAESDLGPKNAKVEQNIVREKAAETLIEAQADVKRGRASSAKRKVREFKAKLAEEEVDDCEMARVDMLLNDRVIDSDKEMMENNDILAKQAYRPAKACYSAMNSVQERFLAKKK